MIERYTLPEMGKIWSIQNKFQCLLDVEKAVAKVQARLKIIPESAATSILKKATFNVERILEIEKTTKHDIIAFVSNVAESLGSEDGRFVHFGLTSSDILDTALSLQIRKASELLLKKIKGLDAALVKQIKTHQNTVCVGRTHGIHAEPTTFGLKLSGFLVELRRNERRVKSACSQVCVVKMSGAVGTYSSMSVDVEQGVAKVLNLPCEVVATQVVPRDRHAEVFSSLALLGAGFERLAVEIRHLQRTEVGEVQESFGAGQKGSSAMPHKRNPIVSENITGMARLLRGYLVSAMEDVALWHERDISHSSVERVIFPDAFIVADYAATRLTEVILNLEVNTKTMQKNLNLTRGQVYSSHVLLELIRKGLSRENAYKLVQRASHQLGENENLMTNLLKDPEVSKLLKPEELKKIFSGKAHLGKNIQDIIERALKS